MIIRVVCEGSTDFAVLGVVVRAVLKDREPVITAVQPDFDAELARFVDKLRSRAQALRRAKKAGRLI